MNAPQAPDTKAKAPTRTRKSSEEPRQAADDRLAAEIADELEQRGLPPGAWLVDIGRVRQSLQEADALLRRMEAAIIRAARSSPLDS